MTVLGISASQLLELLWFAGVFSILAMSLNLVMGQAGLFQLGQVGFFALGGIATVFATHADHLALDFVMGLLLGAVFAAVAAVVLGLPTLRLRGDYFAIATLGFGTGVWVVLKVYFIQGVFGVPPINFFGNPIPIATTWLGLHLTWRHIELAVVLVVVGLTYWLLARLQRSPFGRLLRAVREDELAVQALGRNTMMIKLKAFVLSGVLTAVAGSLYVHHLRVFDPSAYDFRLTILILVMVILGGLGSNQGAVLGAALVTVFNEVAKAWSREAANLVEQAGDRFIAPGALDPDPAALNIMLFAALLVALMILRPQGILGDRDFDLRTLLRRTFGGGGSGGGSGGAQGGKAVPRAAPDDTGPTASGERPGPPGDLDEESAGGVQREGRT